MYIGPPHPTSFPWKLWSPPIPSTGVNHHVPIFPPSVLQFPWFSTMFHQISIAFHQLPIFFAIKRCHTSPGEGTACGPNDVRSSAADLRSWNGCGGSFFPVKWFSNHWKSIRFQNTNSIIANCYCYCYCCWSTVCWCASSATSRSFKSCLKPLSRRMLTWWHRENYPLVN